MMKKFAVYRFWQSSIGKKIIVALTGAALVLFLAGHLSGNLLMYLGKDAFDEYAKFLHSFLHGTGVWFARIGLLVCLVLHVGATIALVIQNKKAKMHSYECDKYVQANRGSRWMIWSGLTIMAFVVFHILHFTVRVDSDLAQLAKTSPYEMVIVGFQNKLVVIFYLIAMTCLCSHLSHGVASIFQTIGLRTRKNAKLIDLGSKAYTVVIYLGFISVPIAVYFGLIS